MKILEMQQFFGYGFLAAMQLLFWFCSVQNETILVASFLQPKGKDLIQKFILMKSQ